MSNMLPHNPIIARQDLYGIVLRVFSRSSMFLGAVGLASAIALTGCVSMIPTPIPDTSTPFPTTTPLPTATPFLTATPVPIPTSPPTPTIQPPGCMTVDDLFTRLPSLNNTLQFDVSSFNYDTQSREVNITLSTELENLVAECTVADAVSVQVVQGTNTLSNVDIADGVTRQFSPGEYVVDLTDSSGNVFILGTIAVPDERVEERANREFTSITKVSDDFFSYVSPLFVDTAQAEVLKSQVAQFSELTGLINTEQQQFNVQGYTAFLDKIRQQIDVSLQTAEQHNFEYTSDDAVEEVKRAFVATNFLLSVEDGGNPSLDDMLWMLDMYREHRVNNIEEYEGRRIGFSDPTNFNSVFDMIIMANYVSWQDDQQAERLQLLRDDVDARTVSIARADAIGLFGFPLTAFHEHPEWVKYSGLADKRQAHVNAHPFSVNVSLDNRFSIWPFFLNNVLVRANDHAQRLVFRDTEKLVEALRVFGKEKWLGLRYLDLFPTSNALVLHSLSAGNVNETDVWYDFSSVRSPFLDESVLHPDLLSVETIDSALHNRTLVASFGVRTRGFTGNHGSLYTLRGGSYGNKGALLRSYTFPANVDAGAFRAFGYPLAEQGRPQYLPDTRYPGVVHTEVNIPQESVLLQAGGFIDRAIVFFAPENNIPYNFVDSARYNYEGWGIMCLQDGAVTYPNAVTSAITSYRDGQCVSAGEPWLVPRGAQLPDDLREVESLSNNNRQYYPPLLNASSLPLPAYPFVDRVQSERLFLNHFSDEPANFPYGSGSRIIKAFMLVPALFDEGFSRLPEYHPELLQQFPGIVPAFLDYATNNPHEVHKFFDGVETYYPEASELGWQQQYTESMRALFRGPWFKVTDGTERVILGGEDGLEITGLKENDYIGVHEPLIE